MLRDNQTHTFRWFGILMSVLFAFGVCAFALTRWLPWDAAMRAAIALPLLLFVPGYAMTWVVFPHRADVQESQHASEDSQALDVIERVTLGVILSILVTSLVVYALSPASKLPGMSGRLTPRSLTAAIVAVNILLVGIASVRVLLRRRRSERETS